MMVRKTAVAGQFYPDNKEALAQVLDEHLPESNKLPVKLLISPHAGIDYSGKTAGCGYAALNPDYQRVILLGTSHFVAYDFAAVYPEGKWATPLGETLVDITAVNQITDDSKLRVDPRPHEPEHTLEMQLIFLQHVLTDFKIVPILLGQISAKQQDHIAQTLRKIMTPKTLVVISSDLAHYPPGDIGKLVDEKTIKAILSGNPDYFREEITKIETSGFEGVATAACGATSIAVGLELGRLLKTKWQLNHYEHSGMVTGETQKVVGYASICAI